MKEFNFVHISRKTARLPKVLAVRFIHRMYKTLYQREYGYRALDKLHYMINAELEKKDRSWKILLQTIERQCFGENYHGAYYTYSAQDWILYLIPEGDQSNKRIVCLFAEVESEYDEDEEKSVIEDLKAKELVEDLQLENEEFS